MTRSRGINKTRFVWREEVEVAMLRQHYADTPTKWLAQVFGCSEDQVFRKARRLGLAKSAEYLASEHACRLRRGDQVGAPYRFPKGHVPANKGLRRPGFAPGDMAKTQFKKGERPANEMPIGGFRVVKGKKGQPAYVEVKLTDLPGPYTVRWKPVHRLVWERANGPVPAGHVIGFKPGMKTFVPEEITLDRLDCITHAENARRNPNGIGGMPKELADVHRMRGRLTRCIDKLAKGEKGEPDHE